jgi:hypothetical protein
LPLPDDVVATGEDSTPMDVAGTDVADVVVTAGLLEP